MEGAYIFVQVKHLGSAYFFHFTSGNLRCLLVHLVHQIPFLDLNLPFVWHKNPYYIAPN